MGNKNSPPPNVKIGTLYGNARPDLRSFDLVLFSGDDSVSDLIKYLEYKQLKKPTSGDFSHVGMIVKSDILNHPNVEPGKVYVWESTMSGRLTDGILDVEGESFLGVQLRDFDAVIAAYDLANDTRVAYAHLTDNPLDSHDPELVRGQFTKLFNDLNGTRYDLNFVDLMSALYPVLRPFRSCCPCSAVSSDWLFCSEMVALVYKQMGIFPDAVNPRNVVPTDFLPGVEPGQVPCVIRPPTYLVTAPHYRA